MRLHHIALGAILASALAVSGCGATKDQGAGDSSSAAAGSAAPATGLQYMVPNSPGGGYDTTARAAAQVMEKEGITGTVQVFNLPGAGGTVGLQRVVNEKGNGKLAMQMGLGVVGAAYTQKTEASLNDTTPIAKLIEEAGAIVVPKDSPYQDINQLVEAWKKDPKGLAVGGGSSPGGPDHLLPMQLAQAVGIDPKAVSFVSYDGGGELLPALLGSKIAFGASGFGEFLDQVEAGDVRGPRGDQRRARRRPQGRAHAQGERHRPRVHELARGRGTSRHLRGGQGGLDRRVHEDARLGGLEGRAREARLGRRLRHR
jgi:putative tricarboxylic transport membrane protein